MYVCALRVCGYQTTTLTANVDRLLLQAITDAHGVDANSVGANSGLTLHLYLYMYVLRASADIKQQR